MNFKDQIENITNLIFALDAYAESVDIADHLQRREFERLADRVLDQIDDVEDLATDVKRGLENAVTVRLQTFRANQDERKVKAFLGESENVKMLEKSHAKHRLQSAGAVV